jgi:CBS domain-containing membrane protein
MIGRFGPSQHATPPRELLRASLGAGLGIALTGLLSTLLMGASAPLLIAPMGASAVLLFGVPASPLAQPWAMLGGNLAAAVIGVCAARWIGAPVAAAAVAVGAAFAAMALLRCVHPPSGAVALTAVLGGPHIAALGYGFVLVPVALNSLLLVGAALAWNNLTGRSYPHHAHPLRAGPPDRLTPADFEAVLAEYGEALDIDSDDLAALYRELRARSVLV